MHTGSRICSFLYLLSACLFDLHSKIHIYIYMLTPPCAYIFLSLQEDTYKKQTFLGRRPTFQLSNFLGLTFHFSNFPIFLDFPISNFLGLTFHFCNFPIFLGPAKIGKIGKWQVRPRKIGKLKKWKVRPRRIGKLEKWKVRPRKFGKLEKWKVRPRKFGKLEKWKVRPRKLENWKIRKLGPGKVGGYALVNGSSTNVRVRCSSFSAKQLQERTSAVFKLLREA